MDGADVIIDFDTGETLQVMSKSLTVNMPDSAFQARQIGSDNLSLNTVAMNIPDMTFIRHTVDDFVAAGSIINDPDRADAIFLPREFPLDVEYLHITAIIKTLINYYISNTSVDNCLCLSKWYELIGVVSKMFCNHIRANLSESRFSSTYFYMNKAKKYISKHFCENITVPDIAATLNISPNYLSSIFRSDTGMTISEFINVLRVQKIRELLLDDAMTLEKIAAAVGLRDIRYMQRLFKKHYGVSMQRCKLIDREISLYHTKPWDVDSLTRDIYIHGDEIKKPDDEEENN